MKTIKNIMEEANVPKEKIYYYLTHNNTTGIKQIKKGRTVYFEDEDADIIIKAIKRPKKDIEALVKNLKKRNKKLF